MAGILAAFFTREDGGIYSYSWIINADWMMHLSQVMAFSKLPFWYVLTHNPIYAEAPLNYPFFVNWFSGVLYALSGDLVFAMLLPMILGTFIFLGGAYFLAYTLTGSRWIPFFALSLLFFGAGFHVFTLFSSPDLAHILSQRDYEQDAFLVKQGYHWKAFFETSFLPQRALMWGMGVGFFLFGIFCKWWKKDFQGTSSLHLFLLGCGFGMLSFLHTHSLLFAFLFFALLGVWNIKKWYSFLWIGMGAITIAIPVFSVVLLRDTESFLSLFPLRWAGENAVVFWLKNWGVIPLLFLFLWKPLFIKVWNRNEGAKESEAVIRIWEVFVSVAGVFLISNIIQLQPNWWDNTKIWVWVLFFVGVLGGKAVQWAWEKSKTPERKTKWGIQTGIFLWGILATISGIWMSFSPFFSAGNPLQIFSAPELKKAEVFRGNIPPEALILTSDYFKTFVGPLTPNQMVMGYRGWLQSYGINTNPRSEAVQKMFSGGAPAKKLFAELGVQFVVIDSAARRDWSADEDFFEHEYEKVLSFPDGTRVYKISAGTPEYQ